jgi:NitT/TauT family transport system substrate-binding protein
VLLIVTILGCSASESRPISIDKDGASPVAYRANRTAAERLPNDKDSYRLAASIYAGWMPWYYAADAGVLAKWADREGIQIELVSMDYIASIEAFVTGRADACLVTNVDAVGLPAVAGIDTTVLIIGDYSNGNDQILTRGINTVAGLKGVEISLVELSVSDYLLSRALTKAGMSQRDVRLLNTGDAKIGAEFLADKSRRAVVTWNPIASTLARAPGIRRIYDSSQIPGEILDLCIVNTEKARRDPRLGRALVGAWYEVLSTMHRPDAKGEAALAKMAKLAGCSPAEYQAQLKTTYMFWTAREALAFAESPELQQNMEPVREFCFDKELFGENARSVDEVGIAYPDGAVQGRRDNIRLRFDTSFLKPSR